MVDAAMKGDVDGTSPLLTTGAGWTLEIVVDSGKMNASLRLVRKKTGAAPTRDEILKFIEQSGLSLSAKDRAHVKNVARDLHRGRPGETVLLTQGAPAVAEVNTVSWSVPVESRPGDAPTAGDVDLHEVTRFVNVKEGDVLCRFIRAPPKPGRDVFGQPVSPPAESRTAPVKAGPGVALTENGDALVATEAGCLRIVKGTASVDHLFEYRGDVDYKLGNVNVTGKVIIHGNVFSRFHIHATGDILIDGWVEGATLDAGGSITIRGGVVGLSRCSLRAGGSLSAKYIHATKVEATGDVVLENECLNSDVHTFGNVTVSRGAIIGGSVRAAGSVTAPVLGSEQSVKTFVAAGVPRKTEGAVAAAKEAVARARVAVSSAEAALAAAQLQSAEPGAESGAEDPRVVALVLAVQQQKDNLRIALEGLAAAAGLPLAGDEIFVQKRIHPNVTIQIHSIAEKNFKREADGPIHLRGDPETGALVMSPK